MNRKEYENYLISRIHFEMSMAVWDRMYKRADWAEDQNSAFEAYRKLVKIRCKGARRSEKKVKIEMPIDEFYSKYNDFCGWYNLFEAHITRFTNNNSRVPLGDLAVNFQEKLSELWDFMVKNSTIIN